MHPAVSALLVALLVAAASAPASANSDDKNAIYYESDDLTDLALGQPCPAPKMFQCDHDDDEEGDMRNYYICARNSAPGNNSTTWVWTQGKCSGLTICVRKKNWLGRYCRFRFDPFALASR